VPKVDEARVALVPVPGGLTADQVAARALANSATVEARLAELDVARAKVDQTTVQFFPRLTLTASYTRLSEVSAAFGSGALVGAQNPGTLAVGACPGGGAGQCVLDSRGQSVGAAAVAIVMPQDNWALTAKLSVPLSDYVLRLSDAASASAASVHASELQAQAEKLSVQTSARAVYYDWLRARARVVIAEKSLERTRSRLSEATTAYELGTITKADLLRLEALVASTEQMLLETRSFSESTQRQLALIMADPDGAEYTVGEDVSAPRPEVSGTLAELTQHALINRIELKAMNEVRRSLRHASSAASAGAWPRLDAFGEATYANPNQRYFPPASDWNPSWTVGAALTFGLSDAFTSAASARELDASGRAGAAQQRALEDGIRQEIMMYYLSRARAKGALEASRRGLVASEEGYRVATDLYQLGRSTTSDVIDAETDLLGARLAELNARIEIRILDARLRHAAGLDAVAAR
jgi:outer membrane protein TolC